MSLKLNYKNKVRNKEALLKKLYCCKMQFWSLCNSGETWHMMHDMWHVTCDMWWEVNILSKSQVPSSVWEWSFEDISTKDDSIIQSINEWQKCFYNSPGYTGSFININVTMVINVVVSAVVFGTVFVVVFDVVFVFLFVVGVVIIAICPSLGI